jgi:hypothetical protein
MKQLFGKKGIFYSKNRNYAERLGIGIHNVNKSRLRIKFYIYI